MKNKMQIILLVAIIISGLTVHLSCSNLPLSEETWKTAYQIGYADASLDWVKGTTNLENAIEMGEQRALEAWEGL